MKIILVYDVNEKRVSKVLKFLRKFLVWIQNSVFEGELTYSELERLKVSLKRLINEKEDSVVIFSFNESIDLKKEIMGIDKSEDERTI